MSQSSTLVHVGILLLGYLVLLKGKRGLAQAELRTPWEGWARVKEPGTDRRAHAENRRL